MILSHSKTRLVVGLATALLVLTNLGCGDDGESGAPAAITTTARIVEETVVDARTRHLLLDSPAVGATIGVRILLPPHFASQPNHRWPVLYLLHGAQATPSNGPPNYELWTVLADTQALTANTDVLVVMPEGGDVGWYSDWYNKGKGGPPAWETFHLVELREILEKKYRAGDQRAIAGLSMGGFGATSYAARHPGMFRAAASFSGAVTSLQPLAQTIITASLGLRGFPPAALWGNPVAQADIWAAHDPYTLAANLVGIPVFVSSGNGDPGPLDAQGQNVDGLENAALQSAQLFADHLRDLGGNVTTDFYGAGTHTWPYFQQELHRAFPLLMSAIGAS